MKNNVHIITSVLFPFLAGLGVSPSFYTEWCSERESGMLPTDLFSIFLWHSAQ